MAQPNTNNYSISTTPTLIGDLQTTIPGTNLSVPNSNPVPTAVNGVPVAAAFEVQSTTGLLLAPRLSGDDITAITTANPTGIVDGMLYYNSTNNNFVFQQDGSPVILPTGSGAGNVMGPNTQVAGSLAYFQADMDPPTIQDTNAATFGVSILARNLIVSGGTAGTANQLVTFTGTTLTGGTGGTVQPVPVTIDNAGNIAGIASIDVGPGTAANPAYGFTGHAGEGLYYDTVANRTALAGGGYPQLQVGAVANVVNYLTISGAAAGSEPVISAASGAGSDTDISITLTPKGAGQVLNANGTAALPAYSFTGDTNTGVYHPGADQVGIAANGVLNFQVNNGSTLFPNGLVGTAGMGFIADPNTGIYRVGAQQLGVAANGVLNFQVNNGSVYAPNGTAVAPGLAFFAEADTGLWHQGANTIGFAANGGNQFSVTGAVTPVNYLQISGTATTAGVANITAIGGDANVNIGLIARGTGAVAISNTSTTAGGILSLLEGSGTGTAAVSIAAPNNVTGAYTMTLPATSVGTTPNQVLAIGSISGTNLQMAFETNTSLLTSSGTLTASQVQNLSTTPIQLVAAQGANTVIVVFRVVWEFVGTSPFVGAGNIVCEYGSVASGAGPLAVGNLSNASFASLSASTLLFSNPTVTSVVESTAVDTGVYASATTSFTGGGTVNYSIQYVVMNVT